MRVIGKNVSDTGLEIDMMRSRFNNAVGDGPTGGLQKYAPGVRGQERYYDDQTRVRIKGAEAAEVAVEMHRLIKLLQNAK